MTIKFLRRHWLVVALAVLVLGISGLSAPAWARPVAAPLNQTVPLATPTPPVIAPAPTATPVPAEPATSPSQSSAPVQTETEREDEDFDSDSVPFVMPAAIAAAQQEDTEELTALVGVGTLNVREGPGTGFPIIGTFSLNYRLVIEARNPENTWWHACCLPNTETRGWVSAPLLQPNFDPALATQLIPIFGQTGPAPAAPAQSAPTAIPQTAATQPISLTLSQNPPFVWQGKTFDLDLTVVNPNDSALRNLEISNEIAGGLIYVAAGGEGAPTVTERATETGTLVILRWPNIPADAIVNAHITVTVDPTLPNGAVIDNLAAARATNGEYTTGGLTIGLPPVSIPDFQ